MTLGGGGWRRGLFFARREKSKEDETDEPRGTGCSFSEVMIVSLESNLFIALIPLTHFALLRYALPVLRSPASWDAGRMRFALCHFGHYQSGNRMRRFRFLRRKRIIGRRGKQSAPVGPFCHLLFDFRRHQVLLPPVSPSRRPGPGRLPPDCWRCCPGWSPDCPARSRAPAVRSGQW